MASRAGRLVAGAVSDGPGEAALRGRLDSDVACEPCAARDPLVKLLRRLVALTQGQIDDFADVAIDMSDYTPFRRRVIERCRRIGPGQTMSYAELARAAGSPGAARAVGRCMSSNPLPLVVPCHRVIATGGGLGGYSLGAGISQKRQLLAWEASAAGRRA